MTTNSFWLEKNCAPYTEEFKLKSDALDRAEELTEEGVYVYVHDREDGDKIIWESDDLGNDCLVGEEDMHLFAPRG